MHSKGFSGGGIQSPWTHEFEKRASFYEIRAEKGGGSTKIIYVPTGRAAEYTDGGLAANWYDGCGHACEYCYAPDVLKKDRNTFHKFPKPKPFALDKLASDCFTLSKAGDTRPVFCSFSCDPYQQIDAEMGLTREALIVLFTYGRSVILLTKGGERSMRDFDLLAANAGRVKYGATLVFQDDGASRMHEPNAAPTSRRIDALKAAHDLGIRTWVSLEPVYYPTDTFALIDMTKDFVDEYRVGRLNYRPEAREVDWGKFAMEVEKKLKSTGKAYYIKSDLKKVQERY